MSITLISPDRLHAQRGPQPFLILDARSHGEYLAGHIPGAIWMGWETWCEKAPVDVGTVLSQDGYWGKLRDDTPEVLARRLGEYGVSNERPILVYADGRHSKGRDARIAWMLLYWGLSHVSLLNGGWRGWLEQGGVADVIVPQPVYNTVHIDVQEHRRIQLEQLKLAMQRRSAPPVIDVRSRAEFLGQRYEYQPRMGRMPGAIHFPYTALYDEVGYFITQRSYLRSLSPEVVHANSLVACCEVGVRSCLFALLHEMYTGQVVANFDGSIMEWALDKTLPMERNV